MKELLRTTGLSFQDLDAVVLGAVTAQRAPGKNGPHSPQHSQLKYDVSAGDVCSYLHCGCVLGVRGPWRARTVLSPIMLGTVTSLHHGVPLSGPLQMKGLAPLLWCAEGRSQRYKEGAQKEG